MLKRLWLVLSGIWAACTIGAQLGAGAEVTDKVVFVAAMPAIVALFLWMAGKYVVTGRVR